MDSTCIEKNTVSGIRLIGQKYQAKLVLEPAKLLGAWRHCLHASADSRTGVIMILLMLNGYSTSILKQKQKSERFPRDQEGSVNGRYMEGFSSCRLSQKISIRHCRWSFKLPPLQFHHTIYPHWNDFSDKPEKLRAAPEHRAAAPPGFARKGLEQPADRFSSIRRKGQLLHNNE